MARTHFSLCFHIYIVGDLSEIPLDGDVIEELFRTPVLMKCRNIVIEVSKYQKIKCKHSLREWVYHIGEVWKLNGA